MRLHNKVALITGAARGIGRATAIRFAWEGACLALFDLDALQGEKTAAEVRQTGAEAIFVAGDIANPTEVKAAVDQTVAAFGRLDILVNAAGILLLGKDVPVVELEIEVWDKVMAVNLTGTYLACKYAIAAMIKGGGGMVINIASIAAFSGWDTAGAYSASKGGVMALTRDIAKAYAKFNVRANAICPGLVDTPMVAKLADDPSWRADIAATPMKRMAAPEEIASAALFLATEDASFITGASLIVDGGLTA